MAAISIRGVRKSYGATQVIHGVDVEVADGELIVIVGPSGCGKSTLLRMVAGLETVTSGEISIGGRVVNDVEPKDRDIAMVFQNYALYPHMTVFHNMAYGLRNAGTPLMEIEERVRRAAKTLELEELLTRRPRELSGGQRQRVAMGRAIVREPAAFLFDEPLSNLDAKLRVQMRLEIRQLQQALKATSLYVTHDQVEAMTLADRLVVLNQGRAEQIDTPLSVYEKPASLFVAGFIGSPAMNFFEGKLGADGVFELNAGGRLKLGHGVAGLEQGRALTLGVRPENLTPATNDRATFSLRVAAVETLGSDTLVHGFVTGGAERSVSIAGRGAESIALRLPGHARIALGDLLPAAFESGAVHLFDSADGKRVV